MCERLIVSFKNNFVSPFWDQDQWENELDKNEYIQEDKDKETRKEGEKQRKEGN
jgi:hypothetical protein